MGTKPKCSTPSCDVISKEKDCVWSWVLCACVSYNLAIVTGFLVASSSVLFVTLLDEFGESKETTAWVGSISTGMVTIPGPLGAYLSNRFGIRRIAVLGCIIFAGGVFISSYSPSILVICLTYSFLGGLGGGIVFNTSYSAISESFEKFRSFAFGLINFGLALGYISMSLLSAWLIQAVGLWVSLRIMSMVCLSCCLFCCLYPPSSSLSDPEGAKVTLTAQLSVLKNKLFMALTLLHCVAFLGFYVPLQHLLRYAEEQNVPKEKSSFFMTFFSIASCISRLLVSKLVHMMREDLHTLFISQASLVILGVASLLVCTTSSYYAILGFYILYGLADGGFITHQCVLVCRFVGPRNLSMAWGIFTLCFAMAIILGAPIAGFLADITRVYYPTFFFAGFAMIIPGALFPILLFYAPGVLSFRTANSKTCDTTRPLYAEHTTRVTCV